MIYLKNCLFNRENGFHLTIDILKIEESSRVILVGASGSGKTTLLRILAGLEENFSGHYEIDGVARDHLGSLKERSVMFLSQDFLLWEHLNVIEHINFVLNRGKHLKNTQESLYFLEMVGLVHKKESKIYQLSTGEKQRLALARALSAKARYLFLDEPFSNIDLVLAQELIEIIEQRQNIDKFALVESTHHHLGFEKETNQIVILNSGKIIQRGTWHEIQNSPKSSWVEKWVNLV